MITAQQLFASPRSKIQRSNHFIDELMRHSAPLDRELYELTNRKERISVIHLDPTVYRITYPPKADIPMTFAAIIGDAFNNIREAFDYTAAAIVDTWGQRPKGKLYFPITQRKDLIAHTGFTAIAQAVPGFADAFLDEVRPADGPHEHLWDFNTLHRDAKHNDFVPVGTVVNIELINARISGTAAQALMQTAQATCSSPTGQSP